MAPKRPLEDDAASSQPKKQRTGFKVGPDNLPDGTWRRKVIKIKKDLIHKAKVKKSYAKLLAREPTTSTSTSTPSLPTEPVPEPSQELHPERQAMLNAPREATPPPLASQESQFQNRPRERRQKPKYFEKEQEFAERKRKEAEERRQEFERRDRERRQKIEERERFRRAMGKARSAGRNGQRKLGRESGVLLEKVRRMVGE